ncbi:rCG52950, isoform CRA_a [Rattus norvegicus]|uniref:RCG52950, isoform CRA_a n=1 Tax=Rattus norvegicus TaxID=10116 RepID=A6IQS8_RAT|nr:rCG52950, isoform CRA_a [Rattus norvegicus]EDM11082.1 rCG52950, isoform CRA_a [Rattus norvegicus]
MFPLLCPSFTGRGRNRRITKESMTLFPDSCSSYENYSVTWQRMSLQSSETMTLQEDLTSSQFRKPYKKPGCTCSLHLRSFQ